MDLLIVVKKVINLFEYDVLLDKVVVIIDDLDVCYIVYVDVEVWLLDNVL